MLFFILTVHTFFLSVALHENKPILDEDKSSVIDSLSLPLFSQALEKDN